MGVSFFAGCIWLKYTKNQFQCHFFKSELYLHLIQIELAAKMSWPDLDDISEDTERLLRKNYEDNGFCFQTRLNLSEFITTYFIQEELEQVVACELVTQLLEKLREYIATITRKRETGLFTIRRTLKKTYDTLQVNSLILNSIWP